MREMTIEVPDTVWNWLVNTGAERDVQPEDMAVKALRDYIRNEDRPKLIVRYG